MALTNVKLKRIFILGSCLIILFSAKVAIHLSSAHFLPTEFSLFFDPSPEEDNGDTCPNNMTRLEDIVADSNPSSKIPLQIHVVTRNRCVSHDVKENIDKWHMQGYSLLFYDDAAADAVLSLDRPVLSKSLAPIRCISKSEFKTEIVKLLLLWDKGGIVIDENKVPRDEEALKNLIRDDDEGLFFVSGGGDKPTYSDTYMASMPEHPILYTLIQKTFADFFMQITDESFLPSSAERKSGHFEFILKYIFSQNTEIDSVRSKHEGMGRNITTVKLSDDGSKLFANATLSQPIEGFTASSTNTCVTWDKAEENSKIQASLRELVGSSKIQCPENQYFINDTINLQKMSNRKIPKVVHMTSKTRCMPEDFAENLKTWLFKDYSLYLHDDAAVARLFSRDWPEFPLLHDAVNCITSGAGFADLWRYLILWEYGGVYTDLDNTPGPLFQNGTIIEDHMDSFMEVETAKIPSQYFIAVSPKHPIMYMTIQNTIQRLFNEQNIVRQYVPYITGPGALKWGVHYAIGNAYLSPGTYPTFDKSRHMTIVGNKTAAMRRYYIHRGSISTKDNYKSMNMTHYSIAGRQRGLPQKSCLEVLYDLNVDGKKYDMLGLDRLSDKHNKN